MSRHSRNRITGQPQQEIETVIMIPAACPACASVRRGKFEDTSRLESSGITDAGQPYSCVVWRRTYCLDCGQRYVCKSFENLPEPKSDARVTTEPNESDVRVTPPQEVESDARVTVEPDTSDAHVTGAE